MAVKDQDQLGMDERVLEDEKLERFLNARLQAQDNVREVTRTFDEADAAVKGYLAQVEPPLEDGEVIRIGRFRITKSVRLGGHREFDTKDSSRLTIKLFGD